MICKHAIKINRPNTIQCRLGLYGGRPHAGVCKKCGGGRGIIFWRTPKAAAPIEWDCTRQFILSRQPPALFGLLLATEDRIASPNCGNCEADRMRRRLCDALPRVWKRPLPWTNAVLSQLSAAGMVILKPDLRDYEQSLATANAEFPPATALPRTITLGMIFHGHIGDVLCASTLPRQIALRHQRLPNVLDLPVYRAVFANNPYVAGFSAANDRITLAQWNNGRAHHIQRCERWFGIEPQLFPRPDIFLTAPEIAAAEKWRAGFPPDKPLIALCAGAVSNQRPDPYASRPWARWAAILAERATVVQFRLSSRHSYIAPWTDAWYEDQPIPETSQETDLPFRAWAACLSVCDGYFGTWAAGSHLAAAFGLPAIIHMTNAMPGNPQFPANGGINGFLYPQHFFARQISEDKPIE